MTNPKSEKLLCEVVRKHYVPIADPKECAGAQLLDGEWRMPVYGCDTLQNMLDDLKEAIETQNSNLSALAVPPFRLGDYNRVLDANGARVLACSEETTCPLRFAEPAVEKDGHFVCPNCGRLGQRMTEAAPWQCGLAPVY